MLLSGASDEQLLLARDPVDAGAAFGEFYRRHERSVLAFHVRRVRDAELAADLAASTFAEALASRHRFHGSRPGDSAAWLYGIAHHVLSHYRRRKAVEFRHFERQIHELPVLTDLQVQAIDRLTESGPLTEALEQLPAAQRDAVRAYVLGDQTYDEIAAGSNIAQSAARKRVSRGLAALRANQKEAR